MRAALVTLVPMLAAAVLVMVGGEHMARREVETRTPFDRQRLLDLDEAFRTELSRPRSLIAERGGESIDLTPREISMLRLLHEHRGAAVSRDVFLDTCWGLDYFPDSRTLDQHILLLRKKIELDSANPVIIQTVRAIGNRLGK